MCKTHRLLMCLPAPCPARCMARQKLIHLLTSPAPPCTQCLYKISSPAGISSIWPIEYRFISSWGHIYICCPFHLPNITNHLTRCSWCSARLLSSGAVSYVPILPARHYPHNYPFYSKMRFFYFLAIVFYLENQKNFYNYP